MASPGHRGAGRRGAGRREERYEEVSEPLTSILTFGLFFVRLSEGLGISFSTLRFPLQALVTLSFQLRLPLLSFRVSLKSCTCTFALAFALTLAFTFGFSRRLSHSALDFGTSTLLCPILVG